MENTGMVWWENLIKANKFMEDIVTSMAEGKSVLLFFQETVPWKNTLLELVEEQVKMENSKNTMEVIQCPEEEAGLFLLNKYCTKERRSSYRYGVSYAEFLGNCEDIILNDKYIWIQEVPPERCGEWLDFISDYNKYSRKKTPAVFVLEVHGGPVCNTRKGIRKLIFDQEVTAYDRYSFCAMAAGSSSNCKEYQYPYLAELASSIGKDDIELCAQCVQAGTRFLKDPERTLERIVSESCRSDGKAFTYTRPAEELKSMIWEAQLKNVFPVIEKYRSCFVKKYSASIKAALPFSNSFGQIISNPEEVEIGMLIYLVGNRTIHLEDGLEYQELEMMRDARNKLAHLNVMDFETVDKIMKKAKSL